jgi:CHASE3 domain sensor protein
MTRYIVVRANTLLFGVLAATLLLIGVAAWDRFNADQSARGWSQHSYEVLGGIQDLNLALREAESGQRGYLLTGKADYLAPYQAALARIDALQSNLLRLTADNPTEQERLRTLAPILRHKLEEMARVVQVRDDADFDAALKIVQTDAGIGLMQQIDAVLGTMRVEEQRLLAERIDAMESRGNWVRGLVLGGAILAIAALLWAVRLLNQALRYSLPTGD